MGFCHHFYDCRFKTKGKPLKFPFAGLDLSLNLFFSLTFDL